MYVAEHTFARREDKKVALPPLRQRATTMRSVNLLIVNGHLLFREALRALFRDRNDIRIVGEVCDYGEALSVAGDRTIDIVVLDVALQGLHRIDMIGALKAMHPAMKILVLSAHCDLTTVASAMAGGANGFLTPECDLEEMVSAIHHISAGRRYVCPNIAHDMAMQVIHANARMLPERQPYALTFA
jgi:two-component system invasion response regulator UvrY